MRGRNDALLRGGRESEAVDFSSVRDYALRNASRFSELLSGGAQGGPPA